MTSQIESIRSTQYTPLYENYLVESRSSQWRLLLETDRWTDRQTESKTDRQTESKTDRQT